MNFSISLTCARGIIPLKRLPDLIPCERPIVVRTSVSTPRINGVVPGNVRIFHADLFAVIRNGYAWKQLSHYRDSLSEVAPEPRKYPRSVVISSLKFKVITHRRSKITQTPCLHPSRIQLPLADCPSTRRWFFWNPGDLNYSRHCRWSRSSMENPLQPCNNLSFGQFQRKLRPPSVASRTRPVFLATGWPCRKFPAGCSCSRVWVTTSPRDRCWARKVARPESLLPRKDQRPRRPGSRRRPFRSSILVCSVDRECLSATVLKRVLIDLPWILRPREDYGSSRPVDLARSRESSRLHVPRSKSKRHRWTRWAGNKNFSLAWKLVLGGLCLLITQLFGRWRVPFTILPGCQM